MVIPWSCSSDRASSRKAYSNGLPVRRHSLRTASSFPCGSESVSASRRPTTVLLPWSTWPTITMFICSRATEGAAVAFSDLAIIGLHVSFAAKLFQAVFPVLQPAGSFRDIFQLAAFKLGDDVIHIF